MPIEREKSHDVSRIAGTIAHGRNFGFARVVTGDEAWLYLNYFHTHLWLVSHDGLPVGIDQTITNEKYILNVLSSIKDP
jgi:hypothetical protein